MSNNLYKVSGEELIVIANDIRAREFYDKQGMLLSSMPQRIASMNRARVYTFSWDSSRDKGAVWPDVFFSENKNYLVICTDLNGTKTNLENHTISVAGTELKGGVALISGTSVSKPVYNITYHSITNWAPSNASYAEFQFFLIDTFNN